MGGKIGETGIANFSEASESGPINRAQSVLRLMKQVMSLPGHTATEPIATEFPIDRFGFSADVNIGREGDAMTVTYPKEGGRNA